MQIDQAIFSSARTPRADGYQVVAASQGVSDEESRELAIWGPSHGSLCRKDQATSINFHRLASGRYCLSKSAGGGEEYSGRGQRIDTHFLLVPVDVLARFANNPFAVLRAAWAKGFLGAYNGSAPPHLVSFSLAGRAAAVDEGLLAQWAECGPRKAARLIETAQSLGSKLLTGVDSMETTIGGLLNCLPVECRPEISFSTGLQFSPRRPYRLGPAENGAPDHRANVRLADLEIVDLKRRTDDPPLGWAAYVAELIAADQLSVLVAQLQQPRPGLTMDALDALGEQLLVAFRRSVLAISHAVPRDNPASNHDLVKAAAPALKSSARSSTTVPVFSPDGDLQSAELLQQLDDAVYDSINSQPGAVERVGGLWAQLETRLGDDARRAAREQYLRYTLTLWEGCLEEGLRDPQQAVAALDVLAVLFDTDESL